MALLWLVRVSIRDNGTATAPGGAPPTAQTAPDEAPRDPASVIPVKSVTPPAPATVKTAAAAPLATEPSKGDLDPLALLAMKRRRPIDSGAAASAPPASLTRYSHLGLAKVTHVNERPYRVLSARAVRASEYSPSLGPVLFEENGLRVFEDRAPGWQDLTVAAGSQPLMVNPANGRLSVVTGTLKVSVADAATADSLANDEHLKLIQYDPSIQLAFLKAPAGYQLLPALKRIGQRPGVTQVELEAVEGRAVPR